jgi:hypothetical protein
MLKADPGRKKLFLKIYITEGINKAKIISKLENH